MGAHGSSLFIWFSNSSFAELATAPHIANCLLPILDNYWIAGGQAGKLGCG